MSKNDDLSTIIQRRANSSIVSKPCAFRLPDALVQRAKYAIMERGLRGGLTAMVCAALEGYLDQIEKGVLRFEGAWMRHNGGQTPTLADKVACYGGRYRSPRLGEPPAQYFTSDDLLRHFLSSNWTPATAVLIYKQQQEWLRRGEELVEMPLEPPGWNGYPADAPKVGPTLTFRDRPKPAATPGAPRDLNDLEDHEDDDIA